MANCSLSTILSLCLPVWLLQEGRLLQDNAKVQRSKDPSGGALQVQGPSGARGPQEALGNQLDWDTNLLLLTFDIWTPPNAKDKPEQLLDRWMLLSMPPLWLGCVVIGFACCHSENLTNEQSDFISRGFVKFIHGIVQYQLTQPFFLAALIIFSLFFSQLPNSRRNQSILHVRALFRISKLQPVICP